MTQADSMHSMPPTNTSPTRRNILGTIAAAGATALTLTPARAAALGTDPIYAAIERHKAAKLPWEAAVHVRSNFQEFDGTEDEVARLDDAVDNAWEACEQVGTDLINTVPTTLAGIAAAIRYIILQMSDDGTFMPHHFEYDNGGDAQETMGWIDAWLDTIADAAAKLDRAGKAVRS